MTKAEITAAVDYIKAVAGDDEAAHSKEDDLYHDFVAFVATRNDDIGHLARIVLKTTDINFSRWYA